MPLPIIEARVMPTRSERELQAQLDAAMQRERALREEVARERVQRSRADGNALFWYRLFLLTLAGAAILAYLAAV